MPHRVQLFLRGIRSSELLSMLDRQTPDMKDGRYGEVTFVCDDSYDVAVVLNEALPVHTPPHRTLCFLMEPPEKLRPQPHPSIGTLVSFNHDDQAVFAERFVYHPMVSFLHAQVLPDLGPGPDQKLRPMSMVVSGKADLPFQRHRVALAQALLQSDLPIDFYGRDFQPDPRDPRIKGILPRIDITRGLRDYAYSIACECSPQDGYLTEKFFDCVVNNCIPITNNTTAAAHFPAGSCVLLDPERPLSQTVAALARIIEARAHLDPVPLQHVRDRVLRGDWCLASVIARMIRERVDRWENDPVPRKDLPAAAVSTASSSAHHRPQTPILDNASPSLTSSLTVVVLDPVAGEGSELASLPHPGVSSSLSGEPPIPGTCSWILHRMPVHDMDGSRAATWALTHCSRSPLGVGARINGALGAVRTPYLVLLPSHADARILDHGPRVLDALRLMQRHAHIVQIPLHPATTADSSLKPLDHTADREPPVTGPSESGRLTAFSQGFWHGPCLLRVSSLRAMGPLREAPPQSNSDVEMEYIARWNRRAVVWESLQFQVEGAPSPSDRPGSIAQTVPARTPRVPSPSLALIIPYRHDSAERAENLVIVRQHLERYLSRCGMPGTVLVREQANDGTSFWKTRLVNEAVGACDADIIGIIDADVLIPRLQADLTIAALRERADVCYPYQGLFLNVPRTHVALIGDDIDLRRLSQAPLENMNPASVGGAVFFRRTVFLGSGGMNEHFRSWGREDAEIHARCLKLGYRVHRIPGPIFHLDHPRLIDSRPDQPHHPENCAEYDRIAALDRYALLDEISSWRWTSG